MKRDSDKPPDFQVNKAQGRPSGGWRVGRARYAAWLFGTPTLALAFNAALVYSSGSFNPADMSVLAVASVVAVMVLGAGRLHDIGLSGWLTWLALVPLMNLALFCILLVVPGNPLANRHGEPPAKTSRLMATMAGLCVVSMLVATVLAFRSL